MNDFNPPSGAAMEAAPASKASANTRGTRPSDREHVDADFKRVLRLISDPTLTRVLRQAEGPARDTLKSLDRHVAQRLAVSSLQEADVARMRRALEGAPPAYGRASPLSLVFLCWAESRLPGLVDPPAREQLRSVRVGLRLAVCGRDSSLLEAVTAGLSAWEGNAEEKALLRVVIGRLTSPALDEDAWELLLAELVRARGAVAAAPDDDGRPAVAAALIAAVTGPSDSAPPRSDGEGGAVVPLGEGPSGETLPEPELATGAATPAGEGSRCEDRAVDASLSDNDGRGTSEQDPSLDAISSGLGEILSLGDRVREAMDAVSFRDVQRWSSEVVEAQSRMDAQVDAWFDAQGLDRRGFAGTVAEASRSRKAAAAFVAALGAVRLAEVERRARRVEARRAEIVAECARAEVAVPKAITAATTVEELDRAFERLSPALALGRCRGACLRGDPAAPALLAALAPADRLALHEELFLDHEGSRLRQLAALIADGDLVALDAARVVDLVFSLAENTLMRGEVLPSGLWSWASAALGDDFEPRLARAGLLLRAMERSAEDRWCAPALQQTLGRTPTTFSRAIREVLLRHELLALQPAGRVSRMAEVALDDDVDARCPVLVDALLDAGRRPDAFALAAAAVAVDPPAALSSRLEGAILREFLERTLRKPDGAWALEMLNDVDAWLSSNDGMVVLLYLVDRLSLDGIRETLRHVHADAMARVAEAWPALAGQWLVPRIEGCPTGDAVQALWSDAKRAWDEWVADLGRGNVHPTWLPYSQRYQSQINPVLRGWLVLVDEGRPMPPCDPDHILQDARREDRLQGLHRADLPEVGEPAKGKMIEYILRQRERLEAFERAWPCFRQPVRELVVRKPPSLRDALVTEAERSEESSPAVAIVHRAVLSEVRS